MVGTLIVDEPKCLRDQTQCDARRALLGSPTLRELTAFVQRLRSDIGGDVPDFDPLDGGTTAECLFLLEAPGPRAVQTGFVSRNNPDETAKNWHDLNRLAGIDRRRTLTWNIVPWYIGENSRIRPATQDDINRGLPYLQELLGLLPNLHVVVLVGRKAGCAQSRIREWAGHVEIIELPHPSPTFVNRAPPHRDLILQKLLTVRERLDVTR
ncbi:MAG: uracil-DNA glycosylase [Acidimicrobiales bacterium]|jgi:uracil-DNA glycosylase